MSPNAQRPVQDPDWKALAGVFSLVLLCGLHTRFRDNLRADPRRMEHVHWLGLVTRLRRRFLHRVRNHCKTANSASPGDRAMIDRFEKTTKR
jgi:hypothetical protein